MPRDITSFSCSMKRTDVSDVFEFLLRLEWMRIYINQH